MFDLRILWLSAALRLELIEAISRPEYFDPAKERSGEEASDVLWRAIRGRGGKRGYPQKIRHIAEGLSTGVYSNSYPWVTPEGLEYAKKWHYIVDENILQGSTVWEVESSSSESVAVVAEEVGDEPPTAKARPSIPPTTSSEPASSSSRAGVVTPSARPSSSVVGAKAAAPDQALRPWVFLPDTVLWFDRKFSELFKERKEYRSFEGFRNYQATEDRSFPKFLVFLD